MSHKHKNASKWCKKQVIDSEFNDKAREQVHEQLDISKKLTQRIKMMSGVGGSNNEEISTNNENLDQPEYSKPKAYVSKKEIEMAQKELNNQDEIDDEGDADDLDKSDLKELSKAFTMKLTTKKIFSKRKNRLNQKSKQQNP